jgi:hypothetical protein
MMQGDRSWRHSRGVANSAKAANLSSSLKCRRPVERNRASCQQGRRVPARALRRRAHANRARPFWTEEFEPEPSPHQTTGRYRPRWRKKQVRVQVSHPWLRARVQAAPPIAAADRD